MTDFLHNDMKSFHRQGKITFGLKVKNPYDGTKRVTTPQGFNSAKNKRIQAVHVEVKAEQKEAATRTLKLILASAKFKNRYNGEVRLIPLFDRKSSPYTQEKIKRCIVQHGQFIQCTDMLSCEDIDHLDQRNTKLKKTLRELILHLEDAHIINIDLNWRRDGYQILYKKKYADAAKDKIAHLGAYLHCQYGDDILCSLSAATQRIIKDTE